MAYSREVYPAPRPPDRLASPKARMCTNKSHNTSSPGTSKQQSQQTHKPERKILPARQYDKQRNARLRFVNPWHPSYAFRFFGIRWGRPSGHAWPAALKPLLADTKPRKDFTEEIVGGEPAGNLAQVKLGLTQVFSQQVQGGLT